MEDVHDPSIPVGVGTGIDFGLILSTQNHEVGVVAGIEGVLCSADVVGGVIDPKNFVEVYPVVNEGNTPALLVSERFIVGI